MTPQDTAHQHLLTARALHEAKKVRGEKVYETLDWSSMVAGARVAAGLDGFDSSKVRRRVSMSIEGEKLTICVAHQGRDRRVIAKPSQGFIARPAMYRCRNTNTAEERFADNSLINLNTEDTRCLTPPALYLLVNEDEHCNH